MPLFCRQTCWNFCTPPFAAHYLPASRAAMVHPFRLVPNSCRSSHRDQIQFPGRPLSSPSPSATVPIVLQTQRLLRYSFSFQACHKSSKHNPPIPLNVFALDTCEGISVGYHDLYDHVFSGPCSNVEANGELLYAQLRVELPQGAPYAPYRA